MFSYVITRYMPSVPILSLFISFFSFHSKVALFIYSANFSSSSVLIKYPKKLSILFFNLFEYSFAIVPLRIPELLSVYFVEGFNLKE